MGGKKRITLWWFKNIGFDLWKPEGAFYVFPKIDNAPDFVRDMFQKYHVTTYLGDWFGTKDHVRLSYALYKNKIEEDLDRIKKYTKSI